MTNTPLFPAAVVGGGPAGLAAALALSSTGAGVALATAPHRPAGTKPDTRTAALFAGSIELLRNLGVWDALAEQCVPIAAIRLIDDRRTLLRAPEVVFTADEVGLDVFGYNVPNAALVAALSQKVHEEGGNITCLETEGVDHVEISQDRVCLTLRKGDRIAARLVAGADGRKSICRVAAGIDTNSWTYPQSALACVFEHARPHNNISTEFHRENGPFTVVPMPGNSSSLVWVDAPGEIQRLATLDASEFCQELEARLHGLLGTLGVIGPRSLFPLSGLTVETFAKNRIALVGEAGHVIPPIGAQGLNLGFRDGAALADCVADALSGGRDIGSVEVTNAYANARATDVAQRIWTIDLLNRSLLSPLLPVHLLRGLGLFALKSIAPLRRLAVREGLQPSSAVPGLMMPSGRAGRREEAAGSAAFAGSPA